MADIATAGFALEQYGLPPHWTWKPSFTWSHLRTATGVNEAPIYVQIVYKSDVDHDSGHAVVIRGCYENQNTSERGISAYMDAVEGAYAASTVPTDRDFYYVPKGETGKYNIDVFLELRQ